MLARRLVATLVVTITGSVVALVIGVHDLQDSSAYLLIATALLAIGLFSSTYEIDVDEIRGNVGLLFAVVTVGVLLKAALIAGVMYAAFRQPAYLVLAVAVAQIDPLSVAVMRHRSHLSARARAILSAWSSFDDPVTAILAIYLSAIALRLSSADQNAAGGATSLTGDSLDVGMSLLLNLALVASCLAIWLLLRWFSSGSGRLPARSPFVRAVAMVVLLAATAVAVDNFLLLGLAAVGLFFRPGIGPALRYVAPVAYTSALFMLGMVLADGVNVVPGVLLGVAAFGAQLVVGALLTRSLPGDRLRLALSQQNGITAVILALLLERVFPGTVAVVAPAVLVVSVLHLVSNTVLDKSVERRRLARRRMFPAFAEPSADPFAGARSPAILAAAGSRRETS